MDFNIFLLRLGLEPNNFKNKPIEPVQFDRGFVFETEQIVEERKCPHCSSHDVYINDYRFVEYRCTENQNITDILRVKKPRFKCQKCGKTFTKSLEGINPYSNITNQVKQFIITDFSRPFTFTEIAKNYHISLNHVIKIFDGQVKFVPRLKMPRILCIDEIRFSEEINQKFVCVITDFENKEIVDLIKNRQMPYLREYFDNIPLKERENTKVFISDMYDAYSTICHRYFTNAIHVVDLFHVIAQLTNAVNRIRTRVMNNEAGKGTMEYNFMKAHWKYFLCLKSHIPNKRYVYQKTGESYFYAEMVYECIKLSPDLWDGWMCLQELFRYTDMYTYDEATNFVIWISEKLLKTNNELLKSVGKTYHKWRYEIANGFNKKQTKIRYTNAIAEGLNNQLKTIIKSAYGYHNFNRFRKRAMLIMTYKNKS